MFDSFPKFPTGILYGNYYQLGNFDECVNVIQPLSQVSTNNTPIQGQYCLADVKLIRNQPSSVVNPVNHKKKYSQYWNKLLQHPNRFQFRDKVIHWGICLPSSCTSYDASIFVREIFTSIAVNIGPVDVQVKENNCYVNKKQPLRTGEIIYG